MFLQLNQKTFPVDKWAKSMSILFKDRDYKYLKPGKSSASPVFKNINFKTEMKDLPIKQTSK